MINTLICLVGYTTLAFNVTAESGSVRSFEKCNPRQQCELYIKDVQKPSEVDDYYIIKQDGKTMTYSLKCTKQGDR